MPTAAAGPSPRDPHRHALARQPPRKVRPFCLISLREHRPEQFSDGPTAFSSFHATVLFPNPGPMFELITAQIFIAGRISRAASDLSFGVMTKNKITSIPILGQPAWSRVQVGRLNHKERAWAERRLTGRTTELNQSMVACAATSRPRDFAMRAGSLEVEQLSDCSSLRPDADGSSHHVRGCSSLCDGKDSTMHAEATRSLRTGCASTRVSPA